jgi:hypothetical protein
MSTGGEDIMEKAKNQGKNKKIYQKPNWQKQEIYERFAMKCNHQPGQGAGCNGQPNS